MMKHDELIQESEKMIERLISTASSETAAARLLHAANLICGEMKLMHALGDRSRTKILLTLAGRLTLRAGELLGDTSQEHAWLKELEDEASGMKAAAAAGGQR
jgi:hypothetical protein